MSDYSKTTNFTAKDALTTGDPNKLVKGAYFDTEFDAIATSSSTKANKIISGTTNNVTKQSSGGDLVDSGYSFSGLVGDTAVTKAELDILDGATVTTAELNILDGVTSTAAELNILDGVTATAAELNYVDGVTSNIQTQFDALTSELQSVTATVAANALTLGLSANALSFRNATLTNGLTSLISFSTLSLVVPSGATLGTIDGVLSRLVLVAINNAGTIELAVVNQAGGNDLSEEGVISTTTIGSGSDTSNVFYSTTGRSNVAYRVVGFIESTQATAGTWATSPTLLQGAGGNALTAMSSLGYGQTWQDVSGSRAFATTYYNTTGKPIMVNVSTAGGTTNNLTMSVDINGAGAIIFVRNTPGGIAVNRGLSGSIVIPANTSYAITATAGAANMWIELR